MDKDGGCRFTNPLVVVILGYRPEGRGAGDVMRANGVAALCAAGLILAGCASVTRGTSEPVVFDSEPAGAEMLTDFPRLGARWAEGPTRSLLVSGLPYRIHYRLSDDAVEIGCGC